MKSADDTLFAETSDRIESVTEFTRRVKTLLEAGIRPGWVRGEVSNLRAQASGHVYFSLKDSGAQLSAVLFRGDAAKQTTALRDGLQVLVYGEISVYEVRGQYQLIVRAVIEDGVGRLQREFEALKRRLADEGLFAAEKKRPIPALPATVGFLTSPTGAAVQDFLRILARRGWRGRVVVLPARVQGEGAAAEMVEVLELAQGLGIFDLLVVGRGGGSLEDLWAFNEEMLVRAVAACRVPVISAVGHETDFTIADFAADVRAPTPSAAAEMAVPVAADLSAELALLCRRATRGAGAELRNARLTLERARTRLGDPRRLIDTRRQRLDDLAERALDRLRRRLTGRHADLRAAEMRLNRAHPRRRIDGQRALLVGLRQALEASILRATDRRQRVLEACAAKLGALSPLKVLDRGFSLTQDAQGHLVTRADQVQTGDNVTVRLREGTIDAAVTATKPPAKRS